jgi:hypothetical protein
MNLRYLQFTSLTDTDGSSNYRPIMAMANSIAQSISSSPSPLCPRSSDCGWRRLFQVQSLQNLDVSL